MLPPEPGQYKHMHVPKKSLCTEVFLPLTPNKCHVPTEAKVGLCCHGPYVHVFSLAQASPPATLTHRLYLTALQHIAGQVLLLQQIHHDAHDMILIHQVLDRYFLPVPVQHASSQKSGPVIRIEGRSMEKQCVGSVQKEPQREIGLF